MPAPAFFASDPRRAEYAWNDWDAVAAFIGDQAACRIAVNDGDWPYVVAQTFHFTGDTFLLHFSRSGKLAAALARDAHCTIELDQIVSLIKAPHANHTSAEYRSVVARCTASLSLLDLDSEPATRRILAVRATVVTLSAKKRILAEGSNPAGLDYERYPFPPPPVLSQLSPAAFTSR